MLTPLVNKSKDINVVFITKNDSAPHIFMLSKKQDIDAGARVLKDLESAKWYLWHGNVEEALDKIDACCAICDDAELHYENRKKFYKHLVEMYTYTGLCS